MSSRVPTAYLAEIGATGGRKSRRKLSKKEAQAMAEKSWASRKAGRATKKGKA